MYNVDRKEGEKMARFEFSENEVGALKEMINVAIKSVGIQAAEAGLVLTRKLSMPIPEENKDAKVVPIVSTKEGEKNGNS